MVNPPYSGGCGDCSGRGAMPTSWIVMSASTPAP